MYSLKSGDGTMLNTQQEIKEEVLLFYRNLIGTASRNLNGIDIAAMRSGKQVNTQQISFLLYPITNEDIHKGLKGIKDMIAPGCDGYISLFYKSTWEIVKLDLTKVVKIYFLEGGDL